jgi:hypothetical protein
VKKLTIRLVHVQGRGSVYGGHPDLKDDDCSYSHHPDFVVVSVRKDPDGPFQECGEAKEGGEPVQIPNTLILVPYQEFEGRRQMTFMIA